MYAGDEPTVVVTVTLVFADAGAGAVDPLPAADGPLAPGPGR